MASLPMRCSVCFIFLLVFIPQTFLPISFIIFPSVLCVFMALITLFMQFYIPLMIVTFDLKLIQIYKNALIFAFAGALKNLLLLIIFAAMFVLSYLLLAIPMLNYCIGFALDFLSFRVYFLLSQLYGLSSD